MLARICVNDFLPGRGVLPSVQVGTAGKSGWPGRSA